MSKKHIPILSGTRFGRLTTTNSPYRPNPKGKGEIMYECTCVCNSEPKYYATWKLRSGHSKSCGCLRKDVRRSEGLRTLIKRGIKLHQSELDFIKQTKSEQEDITNGETINPLDSSTKS